jgi:hypothetical protein
MSAVMTSQWPAFAAYWKGVLPRWSHLGEKRRGGGEEGRRGGGEEGRRGGE